ncbi:MAG: hypothetical protein V4808_00205 [Pseudomonadota bacterium]
MKKMFVLSAVIGLASLSACNSTPREQAAENIQANAEMTADNIDDMAANATTDASEDALRNQAAATRDMGDKKAEDMRTNNADTNLANGM